MLSRPSDSIISTRTCCGVSVAIRAIKAAVSASEPAERSTSGGVQTPPLRMREIAARMASTPSVLGIKPEAPNSMQRRIAAGIVIGRHHDHRHAGILRAQIHQAGKAAHARHGQIEQNEIDVAAALEQFGDFVEGAGFRDIHALEQAGDRLAQRAAEQRMVVGNHQAVLLLALHL